MVIQTIPEEYSDNRKTRQNTGSYLCSGLCEGVLSEMYVRGKTFFFETERALLGKGGKGAEREGERES